MAQKLNQPAYHLAVRLRKTFFHRKPRRKIEVKDQTTELEARFAMDLERRSHLFFKNFAKQITDARGRRIFLEFSGAKTRIHISSRSCPSTTR